MLATLIINSKVSAKVLEKKFAPTLLKHYLQSNNDKHIWDAAYEAEYKMWETIMDTEYQELKKLGS